MKKKKLLSLLLAVTMVTGMLPVNAQETAQDKMSAEETDRQQEMARGIYREPFLSGTVQTDLYRCRNLSGKLSD